MSDQQNYKIDSDDDGRWYVIPPEPDQRRIMCGDRRGALLILVCVREAVDPAQEFGRIWDEVRAEQDRTAQRNR
jgi:hypothetical protein